MTRLRSIVPFALYTLLAACALYTVPWLIGAACAASDPVATVTSSTNSLGWPEWLGIGLAAIAGIKAMVDGALAFFRYLAPKTETRVDDEIRDDLQLAHNKLDALSQLVQGIASPAVKQSQAGFARLGLLLALAIVGCATIKSDTAAIAAGVVTCAKGDVPAAKALGLQLGTEALGQLLTAGAVDWAALGAEAEGAAKAQGLTVASCAFGDLVAELDRALHPAAPAGPSARVAVVEPLAGAHAALAAFEAAHGITRIDP